MESGRYYLKELDIAMSNSKVHKPIVGSIQYDINKDQTYIYDGKQWILYTQTQYGFNVNARSVKHCYE